MGPGGDWGVAQAGCQLPSQLRGPLSIRIYSRQIRTACIVYKDKNIDDGGDDEEGG